MVLSSFAAFLARSIKPQSISVYLAAVRHAHLELGYEDPTSSSTLLPRVLRGIKRSMGCDSTTCARLPITMSVLRTLADRLASDPAYSSHERLMLKAAMLLAFYGFLRCAEFTTPAAGFNSSVHATRSSVKWSAQDGKTSLMFFLKQSKTDPFGKGVTIHIGKAAPPLCPVSAMLAYLAGSSGSEADPLFVHQSGKPLTRQSFTDEVRHLLLAGGVVNAGNYAGHSFRIGAATTAAAAGTPEWLIRSMGRWKSDSVLRYIRFDRTAMVELAGKMCLVTHL